MPKILVSLALSSAFITLTFTGCAEPPAQRATANRPVPRINDSFLGSDQTRDLRLFGQGNMTADFEFEAKAATDIQQNTTATEGADFDPALDPTGKRLLFASTRHSKHSHLYTKPIEGATLTQLTDEQADDIQPVYCPAGKRIAFASDRAGQWDIYVMDANGRNVRQITNGPMAELHPSWSPDGRSLVYCRVNAQRAEGELWVIDLDNPGMKRLIGEGLFPTWSPRGNKIAYQRARERGSRTFSIWTLEFSPEDVLYPTEVASSSTAALIAPAWSPDGSQIAYVAIGSNSVTQISEKSPRLSDNEKSDISVVDADGRGMQRLTNGRGQNYSPFWSTDDRVYFTARFENHETIWSVRPFRPSPIEEPAISTGTRRAASANQVSEQE
jgi:TolB protein